MKHQTRITRVPEPRAAVRKRQDEPFNVLVWLVVACVLTACTVVTFAQDAPKGGKPIGSTPPAAKAPESAILARETVREIEAAGKDARIAQLEYENLAREIELAKIRLEKLGDAARKAASAAESVYRAAAIAAGVPEGEVKEYEITPGENGVWVLKRKKKD